MCPRGSMIYTDFLPVSRKIVDLWRLAGHDRLRRVTWHAGHKEGNLVQKGAQMKACSSLSCWCSATTPAGLQAFLSTNYEMILEERRVRDLWKLLSVGVRLYRWEIEFSPLNCLRAFHYCNVFHISACNFLVMSQLFSSLLLKKTPYLCTIWHNNACVWNMKIASPSSKATL